MTYEEMLSFVSVGKIAYRAILPDVTVFRSGDVIIRRTTRKEHIDVFFVASKEEINAFDWQIADDSENEDMLDIIQQCIKNQAIKPNYLDMRLQ